MKRTSWIILWAVLLLVGGNPGAAAALDSSQHTGAPEDTTFVAEFPPLFVAYSVEFDTLLVREGTLPSVPTEGPSGRGLASGVDTTSTDSTQSSRTASTSPSATPTDRTPAGTEASSERAASPLNDGIAMAGLVIDRTHSVIGRDFRNAFNDHWVEPESVSNFSIYIQEQPLPQFGSRISVRVGETTVFTGTLRPDYRRIEQAARQAAMRARYYLEKYYEPREVY